MTYTETKRDERCLKPSKLGRGAEKQSCSVSTSHEYAVEEAPKESVCADITSNPYKRDFPLLASQPGLTFLDSAATAQRPVCVLDAQRNFYETMNANPLRGLYSLSVEATQAIAQVRTQVAAFIGALDKDGNPQPQEIVFTRNASESLNLVAKAFAPVILRPGDEVAITVMEHHSNLIPWQQACRAAGAKLVYLFPSRDGELSDAEIESKIGPRTKIVAAAHISNVLGCELPLTKLADAVHAHGGFLVVDAAQSVPHMPLDLRALGADFLAFSAHKAYGPLGVGVLWGRHELLEQAEPFLTGGEMIESVTLDDAVWAPVPEKFEAGTQDVAGIYAFGTAMTYLGEFVGFETIQAREQALVRYAMERMEQLGFIDLIGSSDPVAHHGVVSFNVRGVHPHDVASILDMQGVCIRAGHHCAQPLLAWLECENRACCRASFAFYNDQRDIDRLIDGFQLVRRTFDR